jgi:hypothetical protein
MAQVALMTEARADIIPAINAQRDFLVNPGNHAENVFYVNNLDALEAANKAIRAANVLAPAVIGAAMVPGTLKAPFPYSTEKTNANTESLRLNSGVYMNAFFESDALGKNHNGSTQVEVPYGSGNGLAVVTMTQFYDQITQGKPTGAANGFVVGSFEDALKYYARETGNVGNQYRPYLRYKMPTFNYRSDTNQAEDQLAYYTPVLINSILPLFSEDAENSTLYTTDDGTQPTTNSFEARSLSTAFKLLRQKQAIRRKMLVTFKGWSFLQQEAQPPQTIGGLKYGPVPIRILPNYLFGCLIRSDEPVDDGNNLGRPLFSASDPGINDVWCKIFPQETQPGQQRPGFIVPYDKTKFFIPDGYDLVEDWSGFIRVIDIRNKAYVDMPLGAVMMGNNAPLNITSSAARQWMNVINPAITTTLAAFFNEANHVAEMFPGNTPHYAGNMMSDMMGLAMYVFNLRLLGIALRRRPPISGGYTKKNITSKKTRNMNKRQRQRRSKSKSMSMFKSAKRAFYRTNKRNKTSRR